MNAKTFRSRARQLWRQEIRPLLIVLLIGFSIRSSLADWNDVPSGSMRPTILEGDRIFVNKLAYDLKVPFTTWHLASWSGPKRGDVVVFYSPADGIRLVKRVVGLPGDRVELRNNQLFVNGEAAEYGPLDTTISDQVQISERAAARFALEALGGRSHAVMSLPMINAMRTIPEWTVPDGNYFVLGDNRDNSKDSRYIGVVPREKILGRAWAVAFSVDPDRHYLPRWSRSFSALN